MAGHSKFKNIQFRKGAQDKRRAKQFSRLVREITVAAAVGGADEASNPRLRTAIQNARAANMPKDNITRAISKSSDKTSVNYEEIRYEGFAAGGVGVIIEALSDNRNRTASGIRSLLTKFGGNLGENNSVSFMFTQMGEVFYKPDAFDEEKALDVALEADVSDCHSTQEGHFFFCPRERMEESARALEKITRKVPDSQRLAWLATNSVEVDETSFDSLCKIVEALEDHDDVQYVYTNASAPEGELLLYAPV